ncbi:MAG: primase C-terminal domain-containing protein, partial [Dehalococcoidia bacterium]
DGEVSDWQEKLQPKVWAMVTGPISGIFVMDCDTPESAGAFTIAGLLPHVKTPRGSHYYFRYPQFRVANATGIAQNIDVRGDGGYVNFCGGQYEVLKVPTDENLYQMGQMPRHLLTALQNGKGKPSKVIPAKISAGERDATLTSAAGSMRKRGMSISAMEAALLTTNAEQCDPPLAEADVLKIARSVGRYEPDAPKTVPEEKIIPKLKLTMQAGIYDFTWDNYTAKLSRVKESRERTVGELKVIVQNSEPQTLIQANLNLLSGRSRREAAKDLEVKAPAYDWDAILEQICTQAIELMRGGDPAQDITVDEFSIVVRPEYILYPLIVRRMPNCIFGDPGTLKSTTALLCSQIALLQWVGNPIGVTVGQEPMRGLYLDWETDYDTTMYQLKRLGKGLDISVTSIAYRRCALPLHADLEQLCKYVLETKADYIIVDSLAMASGGEPKETATALNFFGGLRQIKTHYGEPITSLILAHNSKNPEEKKKTIYGNQQYTAQMRNIWESVKRSEPGEDEIDLALFHRKPPPFGKHQHPLGWKYVFNDEKESISIECSDPSSIGEFVERMGTEQRILNCLSGGKQTPKELQERLSITRSNVDTSLSRLRSKGKVVRLEDGAYGLSA